MIYLNNSTIKDWNFDNSNITKVYRNNSVVYQKVTAGDSPTPTHDYSTDYLTFVAKQDSTFTFYGNSINYSLDNGSTWRTLASNTPTSIVGRGDKILWKATLATAYAGIGKFSSTGQFDVEGNVMSLLYGDNFIGQTSLAGKNYAFKYLFTGCTTVVSAENLILPATTLANYCYNSMFYGCTSLTTAPELPATTMATLCYSSMFSRCTSLTTAPALPATTLASNCYAYMFSDCTSLTNAPELPVITLKERCYIQMFQNCTSLTTAPELPATTLAPETYREMFKGCTNLNYIKCLATNVGNGCTNWVDGVSSSGTFVKAANMTGWQTGNSGIPSGWTVQDNI